jgi:Protein of unknown function DUF262
VGTDRFNIPITSHTTRKFTLRDVLDMNSEAALKFNTEYQRSKVWNKQKKQLLIDSILRNYDIASVFLRQKSNNTHYECLDGQQRLKAIIEFLNDGFALSPSITEELGGNPAKFSQLPDNYRAYIKEYKINSVIVADIDEETTSDIFLRLQEGMPLNSAEKLNAIRGKMRKKAIEISQHPFFSKIGLSNSRFAHRYLAAQMLALSISGKVLSVNYNLLKKYYMMHKSQVPEAALNRVSSALSFLDRSLGDKASEIRHKSDILSLYLLVTSLRSGYSVTGLDEKLAEFVFDFIYNVQNSNRLQNNVNNKPYKVYASLRSDSAPHIKDRRNIILSKFLQFLPSTLPRDPTRGYNYAERLAIFQESKGMCVKCHALTPFNRGVAEHIQKSEDRGSTTVDNGRWICEQCQITIRR